MYYQSRVVKCAERAWSRPLQEGTTEVHVTRSWHTEPSPALHLATFTASSSSRILLVYRIERPGVLCAKYLSPCTPITFSISTRFGCYRSLVNAMLLHTIVDFPVRLAQLFHACLEHSPICSAQGPCGAKLEEPLK